MTEEVSVSMEHREYLVRMLEALACDCDSTDGWENAAPDLRKAAALLRATHSPSEAEVGAQRDFIDYHRSQLLNYLLPTANKLKNWSAINYHIQKLHEGGATAITALSRPSDKTVELLREMQHAVAGLMSQFDHIGCTCTFPDDTCCAFAMAETRLAKLDAHLGEKA